jgi:cellulase/cellobiase CelA1
MVMIDALNRMRMRATPITSAGRRALWATAFVDVSVAAWMMAAGEWLDRAHPVTSVATLGGRHELVLGLTIAALVALLVSALLTAGFTTADTTGRVLLALAGGLSVVAAAGLLCLAALVLAVVALVVVLLR